jgi:uncharacterized protein (DUF697 family)
VSAKKQRTVMTVGTYRRWFIGTAPIPILLVDLATIAGVQLKMLAAIAKIYGVPFHKSRGGAVAASWIGAAAPRHALRTSRKAAGRLQP